MPWALALGDDAKFGMMLPLFRTEEFAQAFIDKKSFQGKAALVIDNPRKLHSILKPLESIGCRCVGIDPLQENSSVGPVADILAVLDFELGNNQT